MTLDLNDLKIARVCNMLTDVLANRDVNKIADHFTDDAVMIINEKKLQRQDIDNRIGWIKQNTQSIIVKVCTVFFQGDQGFDYHTSEVIDNTGKRSLYKIFGYTKLKDGKICYYEDVTIQLEGESALHAINSIITVDK